METLQWTVKRMLLSSHGCQIGKVVSVPKKLNICIIGQDFMNCFILLDNEIILSSVHGIRTPKGLAVEFYSNIRLFN